MPSRKAPAEVQSWMAQIAEIPDETVRQRLVRERPDLHKPGTVEQLYDEVVRQTRIDLDRAGRLADAAQWIATAIGEDASVALAARAVGHVLYLSRCDAPALRQYERALEIYERLGLEVELARTINGTLQSLIYLGQSDRALDLAERAHAIFARHGDRLRLARLEANVANIFYRQDRLQEALARYRHAVSELRACGSGEDVAITVRNMAVCLISVGQFAEALAAYEEARAYCDEHGLPLLAVEADYNIAYLYFLRGEYTRAIAMYETTRRRCAALNDPYHAALCDLDQSEMDLELNLNSEGGELARRAYDSFRLLEMGYEAAKALAFLAIAESKEGRRDTSLQWFDQSRELFVREQNELWPMLIDLYKALVLYDAGEDGQSRRLAGEALAYFVRANHQGKAGLARLLLARLDLRAGDGESARRRCLETLESASTRDMPALSFEAHFTLGEVEEALGDAAAARAAYEHAYETIESLRGQMQREELKIAFIENKLAVYESLVWLALRLDGAAAPEAVFQYVERAKSRSLADLIAVRARTLSPRHAPDDGGPEIPELRQKLNVLYRRIEQAQLRPEEQSGERLPRLREEVAHYESLLTEALSRVGEQDRDYSELHQGGIADRASVQAAIPDNARIVEYYQMRGLLVALVIGRNRLDAVPLGSCEPVREAFRLLQFQLSKFGLGSDYTRRFSSEIESATLAHLTTLYDLLVNPIRRLLEAEHLIFVPHGFLHYLPFHALRDGEHFLIDDYSISYAPSASVYQLCAAKTAPPREGALVLGVPDRRAPHIEHEARRVAAALPGAHLSIAAEAQEQILRTVGRSRRFIHIAAHGMFRQDNPLFSSVRLGSSSLSVFDLYDLRISCELVTLSGCGTGLNVVIGGDELIGLLRGFLYAGAEAVLVTLWDVDDESTARFMETFYQEMLRTPDKAMALRVAMRSLRELYSHPYFWAPFALVGKFQNR